MAESRAGCPLEVLVAVQLAPEPGKGGVAPGPELAALVSAIEALPALRLRGLMCIPPPQDEAAAMRPFFRALRLERDRLVEACPGRSLPELSMGMSDDFEEAIAEGATLIRVGTALFGPR